MAPKIFLLSILLLYCVPQWTAIFAKAELSLWWITIRHSMGGWMPGLCHICFSLNMGRWIREMKLCIVLYSTLSKWACSPIRIGVRYHETSCTLRFGIEIASPPRQTLLYPSSGFSDAQWYLKTLEALWLNYLRFVRILLEPLTYSPSPPTHPEPAPKMISWIHLRW